MILKICSSLLLLAAVNTINAQTILPIKEWSAPNENPFVLYISGDGGFNDFSTDLCETINSAGYNLTAINAKTYFWNKKTPAQTVADISSYLQKQFGVHKNQQLILIGYSFGADVMPFIVNGLSPALKNKLISVLLLSPSTSTDFEVHWVDMFSNSKKRNMDVVAEINKMNVPRVTTIFGEKEVNFPVEDIKLKNYTNEYLPGGHNFNGNAAAVVKTMLKFFR